VGSSPASAVRLSGRDEWAFLQLLSDRDQRPCNDSLGPSIGCGEFVCGSGHGREAADDLSILEADETVLDLVIGDLCHAGAELFLGHEVEDSGAVVMLPATEPRCSCAIRPRRTRVDRSRSTRVH
jgi:hypothetical protein